jgi:2-polyprenyl-6-methoxyphenol hydroxylase-like FAD-dependent oxidoreductase
VNSGGPHERCYDVVIAGASLAGCTAAILLARRGASVALVERRPQLDAYKVACTHFIQASATPTIRRLGLDRAIEAAGGVRNSFELWTRWGWIRPPYGRVHGPQPPYGYSIRRQTLDPLLRRLAVETPGVEAMLGRSVIGLEHGHDWARVRVRASSGREQELRARLAVGADGRDSAVARLARLPARRTVNGRFIYWAYYRRLALPGGTRARFWHLDPDVAYALPNDGGLTLLVVMPALTRLPEFKADRVEAFERLVGGLAEHPPLEDAERDSPLLGQVSVPNARRQPVSPGVALVGDAALACDPLPGVGCGWAMQSAEWLANSVGPSLRGESELERGLAAYAARHRAETAHDFGLIRLLSCAKPPRLSWRLLLAAAAHDEELAARLMAHWQRRVRLVDYLTPGTFARSAAVLGHAGLVRDRRSPRAGNASLVRDSTFP